MLVCVVRAPYASQCGDLSFAPMGWINMLNSGGGITGLVITPSTDGGVSGTSAPVGVRGSGTLLMYSSHQPRSVLVCGVAMLFEWNTISGGLTVEVASTVDLTATVVVSW